MTMAIVICGMPPSWRQTSIAIGVVTDFGAADITTAKGAPMSQADPAAVTMPTTAPTATVSDSLGSIARNTRPLRYIGTARATVAGPNHHVRKLPPRLYSE